jgi:DNA polymerase-1
VAEVQALAGDATDNVPGVPGIGVKTAAQLLTEYGDLETLLARAGEIKQPKRRELLLTHAEQARISLKLVTLDCDCPLPLPIEALVARSPEPVRLGAFLTENNFRTLMARLGIGDGGPPNRPRPIVQAAASTEEPANPLEIPFSGYHCVTDMADLEKWVAEAKAAGVIGLDTETTSLDALAAELVGVCLAVAPGKACYIPLRHASADLLAEMPVQLPHDQVIEALRPLLEDPSVLKVLHNAKYDFEVLANPGNGGIQVSPIDDTMMISYALEAGAHGHGMDELSQLHLQHKPMSFDEVTGTGRARISFQHVPLDRATCYAAEDADVTLRLWHLLKPRLREVRALALYEQVERRMIPVLAATWSRPA